MLSSYDHALAKKFSFFPEEKSIIVSGNKKIRYVEMGGGPRTLILFHGATFGWQMWYAMISELATEYRMLAVNLPGAPGTDRPPENVLWNLDSDILEPYVDFVSRLGSGRVALVGHSIGGWLSFKLAQALPAQSAGLCMIDPLGFGVTVPMPFFLAHSKFFTRCLVATIMRGRAGLTRFITSALVQKASMSDDFLHGVFESLEKKESIHPLWFMHALFSGTTLNPGLDLRQEIERIATPTLILWGENDPLVDVKTAHNFFREKIKNGDSRIFPNVGHVPPIEDPISTLKALKSFLVRCTF